MEYIINENIIGSFEDMTGLPSFRRIVFESVMGEGSYIKTELWLPDDWNGIFIGLGNGGLAGNIWHWNLREYVIKGYAVAQTDMGTSRGQNAGINNPDMWADFGGRATHDMAVRSKEIIKDYYKKYPEFSYFSGGSTGGQQAFSLAQSYPKDFDGIIAAVPANNRIFLHTYFLWNHNHLRKPDGSVMFTRADTEEISRAAAEYFQSLGDGEKGDNFVSFPWRGENTVEDFLEFLKISNPQFSDEQISALKAVYEGPKNPSTGKQIYNGMPIGSEIYGCGICDCEDEIPPHYYPFIWTFGENYNPFDFDFDKDLEKVSDTLSVYLNSNSPDLSEFKAAGGKIIAYSGSADPCVPYPDAMKYAERVEKFFGGYENSSSFFRYFLMPGKDHGNGGLGATDLFGANNLGMIETLRLWRETGEAPDYLVAARIKDGNKIFERKIYPLNSAEYPGKPYPPCCDDYYLEK
jgi:feruloyl esterase